MSNCCGTCETCKMEMPSAPGWLSPKNVWFPNVVMIRVRKDCPRCNRQHLALVAEHA